MISGLLDIVVYDLSVYMLYLFSSGLQYLDTSTPINEHLTDSSYVLQTGVLLSC